MTDSPDQPIVLLTIGGLQAMINAGVKSALEQLKADENAQKRLTSAEAARHLGCTTQHLQKLHRRGLPYEKGKPNYYRLADLDAQLQSQRLQHTAG